MPGGTAVVMERPVRAPSGLVVPVAGVAPSDLVDTFDDARSEGRVHDAIDIPARRGTPVVAASAGTVAKLFTSERGGLTVYVLGPDGRTVCYYAHLDAYAPGLAEGDTVAAGTLLGTVGSTGNASPENPHLHFAIWRTGAPGEFWEGENVNPYPLLSGR
jgi:murein DD-endopeptidase MepM/ murein hydrolase activator NlpD